MPHCVKGDALSARAADQALGNSVGANGWPTGKVRSFGSLTPRYGDRSGVPRQSNSSAGALRRSA